MPGIAKFGKENKSKESQTPPDGSEEMSVTSSGNGAMLGIIYEGLRSAVRDALSAGDSNSNADSLEGEEKITGDSLSEELEDILPSADAFSFLNSSDFDTAVSPSMCEADDWDPSCEQYLDMINGVKPGEEGDATFVKNLAQVLWKKDVLARSYIPGYESESEEEFSKFMPTKQSLCPKRLEILKKQWFELRVTCESTGEEIDFEMVDKRAANIPKILTDYISSLNEHILSSEEESLQGDTSPPSFL